ncbi:hypothetical protein LCGC14_1541110, partial [marine sediment metagenome]
MKALNCSDAARQGTAWRGAARPC